MQTRTQNPLLIGILIVVDSLMILLGWELAYEVRVAGDFLPLIATANPIEYRNVVLLALPIWIVIFALCRLYDREELLGGPQEYGNVVKGCLIGFAALIAVSLFIRTPDLARGWLLLGLALTTLLVGTARFGLRRIFYSLRGRGMLVQRALIVGTNDDARAIARQLTPYPHTGVQVAGFVDDYLPVGTPVVEGLRVVASTPDLQSITREQRIDQVILVSGAMTWESFDQLLRGITMASQDKYAIKLSPGLYETLTTGVRVSYKNRVPLLEIERAPITGIDALLKAILDYGLGLAALALTAPIMALVTVGLWACGERGVIAPFTVMGKNGSIFKTYRFRAITPYALPETRAWARGRGFGVFLFQSGLDKLPQLWNVLRGQMSLVGPRPVDPVRAARYQEWLPNLLSLKPGMTGARASSAENTITLDQEMRLELYYARNYSIWLDLQIIFQTMVRMLKRERVLRKSEDAEEHPEWQRRVLVSGER